MLIKNKKVLYSAILFLIIALGFFLRVYNIETAPPGIYPDEAVNGQDAINAMQTGNYAWFYPANNGREGLFMNLIALCFNFFGISIFSLKLPAILFGTLTIFGTYLLAKELFDRRVGLISSYLTAVSFWAINFSRISFRAIMLPAILSFSFYLLYRGLRTKKFLDFALGGIIFGLGMHTYIAFRISPLILIVTLIALILSRENFLKNYWKHILTFVLWAVLSAAPIIYTLYIAHPEYAESRSASISVFSPERNDGRPYLTLLRSFGLSLIKYNLVGDQNWRHNYPPYAILDPLTGTAFLFGIIYSTIIFLRAAQLRLVKKIRHINLDTHLFLITWFFAMLVPEFLTAEGNPHALRAIGTLPAVFIFAALTLNFVITKAKKENYLIHKIYLSLIITILIAIGLFNSIKYHYFWANQERVGYSFNKNLRDISRSIQDMLPTDEKFVITSYNTLEKIPIEIFTITNNVHFYYPDELDRIYPQSQDFIFFFTENNQQAIQIIQQRFPSLIFQKIQNTLGSVYYILK